MISKKEFCSRLDHSILGWTCTEAQVKQFCEEVLEYGFKSICVNPDYVAYSKSILGDKAGISCVIGFPCGANTIQTKIYEGLEALENGATELDCVCNYGLLLNGKDAQLQEELTAFVKAMKEKKADAVVKYIIYAPFGQNPHLPAEATARLAEMVIASGADYIKYCCNPREIIPLVGDRIKMKFSGAVDLACTLDALELGVDRIGEDGAVQWLKETPDDFWGPEA